MYPKIEKLDFGDLYLYKNYLVAVMHQGVTIKPEHNDILVHLAESHFKGAPFAYITHRKNSYAVDPSIYYETSKIEKLVAFAVVSQHAMSNQTVAVEQLFLTKPFKLFTELDDAVAWALKKIEETT